MSVVTGATNGLPWSRPLTYADLENLPEDGHRYELLDGMLLVSPAPSNPHQAAVVELVVLLKTACRDRSLRIIVAPFDVVLAADTALQPDVLVARREDVTHRNLAAPPLLAIEVLSSSTRRVDLLLKRSRYEAAGVASYWLVDPDEPSLTVLELRDGRYEQVAHVTGAESYRATLPFPVTVVPAGLVADC